MTVTNVAAIQTRFVDLVVDRIQNQRSIFNSEDERALFDVVSAAGFNPKAVMFGQLHGQCRDEDGPTGETYPINARCPYKVTNQNAEDDFLATGWLDCAVQYALRLLEQDKSKEEVTEAMRVEIERSVPLKPIILTDIGDELLEYPPSGTTFGVDHTGDDNKLSICVGVHAVCRGWVDRREVTKTHDAICCRVCNLRVSFPKRITTYGELRQHLAELNS